MYPQQLNGYLRKYKKEKHSPQHNTQVRMPSDNFSTIVNIQLPELFPSLTKSLSIRLTLLHQRSGISERAAMS